MPKFTTYSAEEIFSEVVAPLQKQFATEISWFATPGVAITQETTAASDLGSWGALLATLPAKESGKPYINTLAGGQKYVELERMIGSVVCLHLILEGSAKAYTCFTRNQPERDRLTLESFKELSTMFHSILKDDTQLASVIRQLVYSDVGKTSTFKSQNTTLSAQYSDHDELMAAFFAQDIKVVAEQLPSFRNISFEQQQSLIAMINGMKVHLGHVFHIEGGPRLFTGVLAAISENRVTKLDLMSAYIVQVCDAAASSAHGSFLGAAAFTQSSFEGYKQILTVFDILIETALKEAAYDCLLKQRANQFKIPLTSILQATSVRISCLVRFSTPLEAHRVLEALTEFSTTNREAFERILQYFGPKSAQGIDNWLKNPTYIPTPMVNILRAHQDKNIQEKAKEIVKCLAIISSIYHVYFLKNKHLSSQPLSFNQIARLAGKHTDAFLKWDFLSTAISFNEKNEVILDEKSLVEYREITSTPHFSHTTSNRFSLKEAAEKATTAPVEAAAAGTASAPHDLDERKAIGMSSL